MRLTWLLRVLAASSLLAGVLAAPSEARPAAVPTIVVSFNANGVVTAAVGATPLGTTSGAPTVIPGGYYSVLLNGPGNCINLPLFELSGPGVDIQDDMLGGEVDTHSLPTYFAPNATFTWHIDRAASTVYTFRTSSDVVGSAAALGIAPASGTSPSSSHGGSKATSNDIVGSAIVPSRGTLGAVVTAAGRVELAFKGKAVTSLKAGRYTVSVVDRSSSSGLVLKGARTVNVTGMAFTGRRSVSVNLTAGRWSFGPSASKSAYTVSVVGG